MHIRISSALLAASLVSLSALDADATDHWLAYSGLQCVKASGSAGTLEYYGGTVTNTSSTGELQVSCSLPGVDVISGIDYPIASISAFDRNPSVNASCNLVVEEAPNNQGLLQTWGDPGGTSGSGANAIWMTTTSPISIVAGQYAWVYCSIPRESGGNRSHIAGISLNFIAPW
jgi:hypothetical protein